jgi:hypothetical protein
MPWYADPREPSGYRWDPPPDQVEATDRRLNDLASGMAAAHDRVEAELAAMRDNARADPLPLYDELVDQYVRLRDVSMVELDAQSRAYRDMTDADIVTDAEIPALVSRRHDPAPDPTPRVGLVEDYERHGWDAGRTDPRPGT